MVIATGTLAFKGLTGGITSEKSVLNIVPTELEKETRNIEVLRDGSIRPRRGADFVGLSETAAYIHTIRTGLATDELTQESNTGTFVPFKNTAGEILDFDIIFQNMSFKIYRHSLVKDYDTTYQTITPTLGTDIAATQAGYTVMLKFANNRLFFSGKYIKPGYLYLAADGTTVAIRYISIHQRDFNVATAASSRVVNAGKYYECIKAHTSNATDLTNFDAYGELNWNQYWVELNPQDAGATAAWSAGTSYTTNIAQVVDKQATVGIANPYSVDYYDERLWLATEDTTYYSTVIDTVDNLKNTATGAIEFGIMFSYNDPFSTEPDPLPIDGGNIPIAVGKVWQILSMEDSMFVATSRQVYEIRGISSRFSSTDFKVSDVLTEGTNGVLNMVVADNKMYIFTSSNIWVSVQQQRNIQGSTTVFGKVGDNKIKSYYQGVPKTNKGTGYPIYSPIKGKIYYFHNGTTSPFDTAHRLVLGQIGYARNIMVIDISTPGTEAETQEQQQLHNHIEIWEYTDNANTGGVYIASAYLSDPVSAAVSNVVVGASTVAVGSDSVIISSASGAEEGGDEIVLIVSQRSISGASITIKGSLGVLESRKLRDWDSSVALGVDYNAIAYLGTQIFETMIDRKSVPYAVFVFEKLVTGVGSCLFRSSFNFALPTTAGEATGKTSGQTEIYKDTKIVASGSVSLSAYKATWYKHKIRGKGVAFQPTLQNTPGKDFKLLGWGELAAVKQRQ